MRLVKSILMSTLAVLLFNCYSFAQKSDKKGTPPQAVLSAFSQKFPAVQKVKWEKEKEGEWEAEFKMNGVEYSANFGTDGTWMETEYDINLKDLPAAVKAALNKDFEGYKVEETEVSETPSGKTYEMEVEKGKSEFKLAFDSEGNLLKKEEDGKGKDKDND